MVDFAMRQLAIPTRAWTRALSLLDGAAPVPRPDHGSTGSYDAWPAMAFDSLTALDAGFGTSLPFLAAVAGAGGDPFGQARGITADGLSLFKTTVGCNRCAGGQVLSVRAVATHTAPSLPLWQLPREQRGRLCRVRPARPLWLRARVARRR